LIVLSTLFKPKIRTQPLSLRAVAAYMLGVRNLILTPPPPVGTERSLFSALGCVDIKVILDVGAFHGEMARRFAVSFPTAQIHCFEPVPSSFDVLVRNTMAFRQIHCHSLALSDRSGRALMTVMKGRQSNRLVDTTSCLDGKETGQVEVTTIDTFCASRGIGSLGIIKTDTEGFDGHVLRGGCMMLKSTQFILSEVTFLPNRPHHTSFADLYAFAQSMGFELRGIYEPMYDKNNVVVYANALFGRGQAEESGGER
jgi:FkbM family methyltransferase